MSAPARQRRPRASAAGRPRGAVAGQPRGYTTRRPRALAPVSVPSGPTVERGHGQLESWWQIIAEDPTPELQWPNSIDVFERMETQDSQVRSVIRAVCLPVAQAKYRLNPKDASDEVVNRVATNLGLPILGVSDQPPAVRRQRDRFSWHQHLEWALLETVYGHMFFEQVYREDPVDGFFWLRKLGPRWPSTIDQINTATDGGLVSIRQKPLPKIGSRGPADAVTLDVSRLVAYSLDRRGGNWMGRSLLRSAYKNWLLKDRALRRWDIRDDRNGVGVPVYTASPEEETLDNGKAIATAHRSGQSAGAALPNGAKLDLIGVQGQLPNIADSVRYHDEAIAKAVLAHFLNLGQQTGTGSYALGVTFVDFFVLSLQTLAQQIVDVANAHIVEDLVDINWGEDEPAPEIVFDPIGQNPSAVVVAIQALITAGAIFPDPALDAFVRELVGLPPKAPLPNATTPAGAAGPPAGTPGSTEANP